jgi:Acetoacetate decarboxylase (ADC)
VFAVPESVPPASVAPAPWSTRLEAVVWWHRATPGARTAVPAALRARAALPLTVVAFVRYAATPVGPYRELLATPVLLLQRTPPAAATIPFIAVDSAASIAAGRANWALPKTLARFDWPPNGREAVAEGDGWSVAARFNALGPALPFAVPAADRQMSEAGEELAIAVRACGRARLASVAVEVAGRRRPGWLRAGRHWAIAVTGARLHVGRARRSVVTAPAPPGNRGA